MREPQASFVAQSRDSVGGQDANQGANQHTKRGAMRCTEHVRRRGTCDAFSGPFVSPTAHRRLVL